MKVTIIPYQKLIRSYLTDTNYVGAEDMKVIALYLHFDKLFNELIMSVFPSCFPLWPHNSVFFFHMHPYSILFHIYFTFIIFQVYSCTLFLNHKFKYFSQTKRNK